MGGSEESDSDGDDPKGRIKRSRGVDGDLDYAPDELAFTKTDYFKVEKLLGIYGWGRWTQILAHCEFKSDLSVDDVAHMCRTVLLHCLRNFTGDDKIREFIWELIRPADASDEDHKSFKAKKAAAAAAVESTRGGRKSSRIAQNEKAAEEKEMMDIFHQGWAAQPAYNPPVMAVDYAYQRHLQRHANKVMLRVKLLYYLKEEIIGVLEEKVDAGMPAEALEMEVPWHPELPAVWWDSDADKSLLIGIFKHGYENFSAMLDDPCLCFLERCGPSEFEEERKAKTALEEAEEDSEEARKAELEAALVAGKEKRASLLPFPSAAELNARFRRLLTLYQRSSKQNMAREEQKARRAHKQEHIQALLQERELRRLEERQRWSRREETDFYRTLISFGVEQDPGTGEYRWERFRQLGRLDNKLDLTLTEHYTALHAMCKRVARRPLSAAEEAVSFMVEPVSEDKAGKVLVRVELMARLRAALRHPKLQQRLHLCRKTGEMPLWWESPLHDTDLLNGVAKHGLTKSDETIARDPDFSFLAIYQRFQKLPQPETSAGAAAQETKVDEKDLPQQSAESDAEKHAQIVADNTQEQSTETNESESKDDEKPKKHSSPDNTKEKKNEEGESAPSDPAKEVPEEEKESAEGTAHGKDEAAKKDEESAGGESAAEKDEEGDKTTTTEKGKEKDATTESIPKSERDPDTTISAILAQSSGATTMQWPKERMIVFRIQNVCTTIETGEWPVGGAAGKGSGSLSAVNSDLDNRSTTPESTRGTPALEVGELARDSPLYNFPKGRSSTGSTRRGRKPKTAAAAAAAANPLQDLMESEREKMRVLMHQSFPATAGAVPSRCRHGHGRRQSRRSSSRSARVSRHARPRAPCQRSPRHASFQHRRRRPRS